MKKWTIDMVLSDGYLQSFLRVPAGANGAMETYNEQEALDALEYWRSDELTKEFQFRLVEWTPRVRED